MNQATLRLLDKTDTDILRLPRAVKVAVYDFQHRFRRNPADPELKLRPIDGRPRLYSAAVDKDHRALLLHAGESDYILVAVKPNDQIRPGLLAYQINPVTGGIEFLDLLSIEETVVPPDVPTRPLFAAYSPETLLSLGVAEPLLDLIAKITTKDELRALSTHAPQLTVEVLTALHDGRTPEEVLDHITTPVAAEDDIDTDDYQAALARPATVVTTDDAALQEILEQGDFGRWRVFLHPTQRKIVERAYSGPARVSGGPGTGKTIVALHRVKHLVDRLGPGEGKDVLLTTFNKNLAADLRQRLLDLAGQEVVRRVDIVNIDKLASDIVSADPSAPDRQWIDDTRAVIEWQELLDESQERRWDAEFLHTEWSQVILGQGVVTRADYFRARRAGRGRPITREDRAAIWQLAERYVMRLDDKGLWTMRQVAERAARLETERARARASYEADQLDAVKLHRESGIWHRPRYRHIVVDEAQDLGPAHWRMLRAMIPESPDDLFIAGDTHQRIYANQVSLGGLGINIRGRSAKLTLSYRTTHEILGTAVRLLGEEEWDDLDDGHDDLTGYRSILRGPTPTYAAYPTAAAELDGIVDQVKSWTDGNTIAVCVPTREMVAQVEHHLGKAGILSCAIGPDGPKLVEATVHIGTMHRFKGLEYQRMIIAGVAEGLVPPARISTYRTEDPLRHRRELKQSRSLLFVAATRARDTILITWHGRKSRFLP